MMNFKLEADDKRDHIRVDYIAPVTIVFPQSTVLLKAVLLNLSVSGMLVELRDDVRYDASDFKGQCVAEIVFTGKGSRLVIDELLATFARIDKNRIAVSFIEPLEWFLLFSVYRDKQIEQE